MPDRGRCGGGAKVERGLKSAPSRLAAAERQRDLQGAALGYRSEAMVPNCATAEDVLKAIKDEKVQMIDLRFPGDPGKRHAGRPGSDDGLPRSVHPRNDAGPDLQHQGPDDRSIV